MKEAKLLQRCERKVGWISSNRPDSSRTGSFLLHIPFYRAH
jgi:hypothetical protein